ncbi:MAG: polysaccharide deacetylase family protein [Pseudomonadales bacterium]
MKTRRPRCRRLPAALLCTLLAASVHAGSAKILLYHHVATDTPPATSTTPARFEAHLDLIESAGYQVVPLTRIVDALESGGALDSRWVAITFDDAYKSLATEAAPRLMARGWPFTVFVGTADVDAGHRPFLGWAALRALHRQGALVANHSRTHDHLVRRLPGESDTDRHTRLTREVTDAQTRLEAELGAVPRLFAYPYGELDETVIDVLRGLGFVAFGQQSGPVGATTNRFAIPRFPLATGFDSLEGLAEKLRTEHLPLVAPEVPATVLPPDTVRPVLRLELALASVRPGSLTCFVNGEPQATVRWPSPGTVEVIAERDIDAGRSRFTCTASFPGIPGAYYWHTHLFMKPFADGHWYDG